MHFSAGYGVHIPVYSHFMGIPLTIATVLHFCPERYNHRALSVVQQKLTVFMTFSRYVYDNFERLWNYLLQYLFIVMDFD